MNNSDDLLKTSPQNFQQTTALPPSETKAFPINLILILLLGILLGAGFVLGLQAMRPAQKNQMNQAKSSDEIISESPGTPLSETIKQTPQPTTNPSPFAQTQPKRSFSKYNFTSRNITFQTPADWTLDSKNSGKTSFSFLPAEGQSFQISIDPIERGYGYSYVFEAPQKTLISGRTAEIEVGRGQADNPEFPGPKDGGMTLIIIKLAPSNGVSENLVLQYQYPLKVATEAKELLDELLKTITIQ